MIITRQIYIALIAFSINISQDSTCRRNTRAPRRRRRTCRTTAPPPPACSTAPEPVQGSTVDQRGFLEIFNVLIHKPTNKPTRTKPSKTKRAKYLNRPALPFGPLSVDKYKSDCSRRSTSVNLPDILKIVGSL